MVKEYKSCLLEGRQDFVVKELGEDFLLFMFDPNCFDLCGEDVTELESFLMRETNSAIGLSLSQVSAGVIIAFVNPMATKFFTKERLKDYLTKFIFDHRIEEDNYGLADDCESSF